MISDGKNPRYKRIDATRLIYNVVDLTEDAVIVSDYDDLHYVDTPIPDPSTSLTLPSNDNDASSTSSDSFEDVDEVLTKHSQKVSSQTAPALYINLVKTSASVSCLLLRLPQREGLGV